MTRRRLVIPMVGLLCVTGAMALAGDAEEGDGLPVIVRVTGPGRLLAGRPGEIRLAFRAPEADVVAVVVTTEDLDGPVLRRATQQREVNVLARAYGLDSGELVVPVRFSTAGRKRVTLVLRSERGVTSDPGDVEVDVAP